MNKDLIEKSVAKHGKKKTLDALIILGMVKTPPNTNGDCEAINCDTGYYFNKTVCACVLDIG